jgi:hypothetical protein
MIFLTVPLLLYLINKFAAAEHQKLLNLGIALEDRECLNYFSLNFWTTRFPDLPKNVEKRQTAAGSPANWENVLTNVLTQAGYCDHCLKTLWEKSKAFDVFSDKVLFILKK